MYHFNNCYSFFPTLLVPQSGFVQDFTIKFYVQILFLVQRISQIATHHPRRLPLPLFRSIPFNSITINYILIIISLLYTFSVEILKRIGGLRVGSVNLSEAYISFMLHA